VVQAAQLRSIVASPSLTTDWPAAQFVRATHAVAGLPSWSQVVPTQATAAVEPPAQYSPALHAAHTGAVVIVPAAVCTVPSAHGTCGSHDVWFDVVVYSPVPQSMHTWSTVLEGVLLT